MPVNKLQRENLTGAIIDGVYQKEAYNKAGVLTEVQKNMPRVTEGIKKTWQIIYLQSKTYVGPGVA